MKRCILLALAVVAGLSLSGNARVDSEVPTVASMPPVVVSTFPPAGATDVDRR